MNALPGEKAVHTVRRLEAFSDIVIGFCLAQLGLNLILPKNAGDALDVWASATFFISAFICIALLWWTYHRILSSYFVLSPLMVILNFALLCGLILTMYFFESVVHLAAIGQRFTQFLNMLVILFSIVYELLGAMLYCGLIARRKELDAKERRWATDQLWSIAMGVPLAMITIALTAHRTWLAFAGIAVAIALYVPRHALRVRIAGE